MKVVRTVSFGDDIFISAAANRTGMSWDTDYGIMKMTDVMREES